MHTGGSSNGGVGNSGEDDRSDYGARGDDLDNGDDRGDDPDYGDDHGARGDDPDNVDDHGDRGDDPDNGDDHGDRGDDPDYGDDHGDRSDDQDDDVHLQFSIEEELHFGVRFKEGFNMFGIDPSYDAWLRLNHPEALGPVCVTPSKHPLSGSSRSDIFLPVIPTSRSKDSSRSPFSDLLNLPKSTSTPKAKPTKTGRARVLTSNECLRQLREKEEKNNKLHWTNNYVNWIEKQRKNRKKKNRNAKQVKESARQTKELSKQLKEIRPKQRKQRRGKRKQRRGKG